MSMNMNMNVNINTNTNPTYQNNINLSKMPDHNMKAVNKTSPVRKLNNNKSEANNQTAYNENDEDGFKLTITDENKKDKESTATTFDPSEYSMNDEDRTKLKIMFLTEKLKSGSKLTGGELEFLDQNAPMMHEMAIDADIVREEFFELINGCSTKEEVSKLKLNTDIGYISKIKPAENAGHHEEALKQTVFKNTTQDVFDHFVYSDEFKAMPYNLGV